MFAVVRDSIGIAGETISADALLTQRQLATYLVGRQSFPDYAALPSVLPKSSAMAVPSSQKNAPPQPK